MTQGKSATIEQEWDERIDRLQEKLPSSLRTALDWIRKPSRMPLRVALALFFILGGVFSFLPILGIWMLPLGIALISQDIPAVKAPAERTARRLEGGWAWCRRRFGRSSGR